MSRFRENFLLFLKMILLAAGKKFAIHLIECFLEQDIAVAFDTSNLQ